MGVKVFDVIVDEIRFEFAHVEFEAIEGID